MVTNNLLLPVVNLFLAHLQHIISFLNRDLQNNQMKQHNQNMNLVVDPNVMDLVYHYDIQQYFF